MSKPKIPSGRSGPKMDHIESVFRLMQVELYSSKARSYFDRRFGWVQIRLHYLLVLGSCRQPYRRAGSDEKQIKEKIEKSAKILNDEIAKAKDKLKGGGISSSLVKNSLTRTMDVKVFTACANRFLDLLIQYDLMVSYLNIMLSHKLISQEEMEWEERQAKSAIQGVDYFILALYDEVVALNQRKNTAAL